MAQTMSEQSKQYYKDAKYVNLQVCPICSRVGAPSPRTLLFRTRLRGIEDGHVCLYRMHSIRPGVFSVRLSSVSTKTVPIMRPFLYCQFSP